MEAADKLLQPDRLKKIINLLSEQGTVKVSRLSTALAVSENTIRRDLIELENSGYCSRSKGGASAVSRTMTGTAFGSRLEVNRRAKEAIARKAAGFVRSGNTVILDSGTTALNLAAELRKKHHITVITPSLDAAGILTGIPDITLILPGGIVHETSRSLTGGPAELFFREIHSDLFFLSVKAVCPVNGLTDHTIEEAAVKKEILKCSGKVVVLADHTKLGKTALSKVADIEDIQVLITDSKAPPGILEEIRAAGVEVLIAEPD